MGLVGAISDIRAKGRHRARLLSSTSAPPEPPSPEVITPPSIAGKLTNGSTITCTPGSWNTGTATRQWYRDGSPISGQTGLTYTYSAVSDDGCYLSCVETNGAATSMSNVLVGSRVLTIYSQDFEGVPDGTLLHGYDGWVSSGATFRPNVKIIGGEICADISVSGNETWTRNIGTTDMAVSMTLVRHSGNYNQANQRIAILRYTDEGNYIYSEIGDHFARLFARINYSGTAISEPIGIDLRDGDVFKTAVVGDVATLFINNIPIGDSNGYDVSAMPKTSYFGLRQDAEPGGGASSYPFPIIKEFAVDAPAANSITLNALTLDNPTGNPGGQRIHVTGTVAGDVTQIEYLLVSADTGQLLQGWTEVEGEPSGSAIDFYITNPPEADNATNYVVWVRDAAEKNTAVSGTILTVAFQQIVPMRVGMNETFLQGYTYTKPTRDRWFQADWRAGGTSIITPPGSLIPKPNAFDAGGVPQIKVGHYWRVNTDIPGYGTVQLMASRDITPGNPADARPTTLAGNSAWSVEYIDGEVFNMTQDGTIMPNASGITTYRSYLPKYWVAGIYEFFYPASMTCNFVAEATDHVVLTPFSGGYGKVEMLIDDPWGPSGAPFPWLDFSGTIPAGGLSYSIRAEGDGAATMCSDEYLAAWQSLSPSIARFMTPQNTNALEIRTTESDMWEGSFNGGPVSTAFMCELVNAIPGCDLYLCLGAGWSDEFITAVILDAHTRLAPDRKLFIEYSNEVWNGLFPQCAWATMRGCELGMATQFGGQTPIDEIFEGTFDNDGLPLESWPINTYVYANVPTGGVGFVVMKSKKAITAGSATDVAISVGQTTNTGWDLIYTNTDTAYARRHYTTHRSLEVFALADAVVGSGARERLVRVIAGQIGGNVNTQSELLTWEDAYLHCDRFAGAPYWGGGILGYDIGSYSDDFPGWTSTEKDLCATDPGAFLDAAFAAFDTVIDATIAYAKQFKQDLARIIAAKPGGHIDLIQLMSYESGWHWYARGPWPAELGDVFPTMITDPRYGLAITRYLEGLRDEVGGDHILFDRLSNVSPGQIVNWGFQSDELDIGPGNARFNAVKAFIEALS